MKHISRSTHTLCLIHPNHPFVPTRSLYRIPLETVSHIGAFFLNHCSGLSGLDLTSLSNVTKIGNWFLHGCSSLTVLDLSPLSNVTQIDGSFLANCWGLTELDLSPLRKLPKAFLRTAAASQRWICHHSVMLQTLMVGFSTAIAASQS